MNNSQSAKPIQENINNQTVGSETNFVYKKSNKRKIIYILVFITTILVSTILTTVVIATIFDDDGSKLQNFKDTLSPLSKTNLDPNLKTYSNNDFNISLNIPKDWSISENHLNEKAPIVLYKGEGDEGSRLEINKYENSTLTSNQQLIKDSRFKDTNEIGNYTYEEYSMGDARVIEISNVPGVFYYNIVYIEKDNNLYTIKWIKHPLEKQITQVEFDQIISNFEFTN